MAIATANIYRATVYLSAGNSAGVLPVATPGPPGQVEVVIIAQSIAAAIAILQTQYGATMIGYNGPVLQATGALTTGTGTLMAEDTVGLPPAHSDAPTQDETTTEPAQTHKPTHNAHATRSHAK